MNPKTKCPECQNVFLINKHLKSGVRADLSSIRYAFKSAAFPWIDGLEAAYKPNLVICPQCGNEFESKGYRFFGVIEPKKLQIGLAAAIILFMFTYLSVMIWSAFSMTN